MATPVAALVNALNGQALVLGADMSSETSDGFRIALVTPAMGFVSTYPGVSAVNSVTPLTASEIEKLDFAWHQQPIRESEIQ